MFPIKTILHPTDFSGHSEAAFQLACTLARNSWARLVVVHVARRPVVAPVEGVFPPGVELYQEELTAKLRSLQAAAPEVRMEQQLLLGDHPAPAILQVAGEVGCDLIVLGTHGRTGLRRVLMGSVAEQVLRQAPCPVLAVKVPPAQPPAVETAQGVRMEAEAK
jgi:nucleotide-binding universal stress UspA family protein